MVGQILLRGMLAGVLAGLLAFGFAHLFGEPQVDRAIAFEEKVAAGKSATAMPGMTMPEAPELVSRRVQSSIGLLTGVLVYGASVGGLFALVFAFSAGRIGRIGARELALLLAGAGFLAVVLVPQLKYPANPPAVGAPETIGYRTEMFLIMMTASIAALAFAADLGRRLVGRHGLWTAILLAGAVYLAIIVIVQSILPDIDEVPADFPAVVLWRFRMAAWGLQFVLWTSLGLIFGWLTQRSLRGRIDAIGARVS